MRGLNEIVPMQDVFASGLGAVERLDGGLYRLWFYVLQTENEAEAPEKIVVARVVTPASDAVLKLAMSFGGAVELMPRMVDMAN